MLIDHFRPVYNYFDACGIKPDAVASYIENLYTGQHGVFDLHITMESVTEPGAEDFINIASNAMMKLAVVDALATMLDVPPAVKLELDRATVMRNLSLHPEKRPNDYKPGLANELINAASRYKYNADLYRAAGPEFFTSNRVDSQDVTLGEKIMLLSSDFVHESERGKPIITDIDTHIDFKITDRPDLDSIEYWEREREMDHQFISELFPNIAPELLPLTIIQQIAINAEKSLLS